MKVFFFLALTILPLSSQAATEWGEYSDMCVKAARAVENMKLKLPEFRGYTSEDVARAAGVKHTWQVVWTIQTAMNHTGTMQELVQFAYEDCMRREALPESERWQ